MGMNSFSEPDEPLSSGVMVSLSNEDGLPVLMVPPASPANSLGAPRYAAKRRGLLGGSGVCFDFDADSRSSRVGAIFSRAVSRDPSDWRAKPVHAPTPRNRADRSHLQ